MIVLFFETITESKKYPLCRRHKLSWRFIKFFTEEI